MINCPTLAFLPSWTSKPRLSDIFLPVLTIIDGIRILGFFLADNRVDHVSNGLSLTSIGQTTSAKKIFDKDPLINPIPTRFVRSFVRVKIICERKRRKKRKERESIGRNGLKFRTRLRAFRIDAHPNSTPESRRRANYRSEGRRESRRTGEKKFESRRKCVRPAKNKRREAKYEAT